MPGENQHTRVTIYDIVGSIETFEDFLKTLGISARVECNAIAGDWNHSFTFHFETSEDILDFKLRYGDDMVSFTGDYHRHIERNYRDPIVDSTTNLLYTSGRGETDQVFSWIN